MWTGQDMLLQSHCGQLATFSSAPGKRPAAPIIAMSLNSSFTVICIAELGSQFQLVVFSEPHVAEVRPDLEYFCEHVIYFVVTC